MPKKISYLGWVFKKTTAVETVWFLRGAKYIGPFPINVFINILEWTGPAPDPVQTFGPSPKFGATAFPWSKASDWTWTGPHRTLTCLSATYPGGFLKCRASHYPYGQISRCLWTQVEHEEVCGRLIQIHLLFKEFRLRNDFFVHFPKDQKQKKDYI